MAEQRDLGISKRIWLRMLQDGGRWTNREIEAAMPGYASSLGSHLKSMVASNLIKRYDPTDGCAFLRFGVTMDCAVPRGLTLTELANAGIRLATLEPEKEAV